jgi:hypothetical protein
MFFRELSALGDANIERIVRQCFQQAGLQVDDLSRALEAKMDSQHQDVVALHSGHQRVLISKLNYNQRKMLLSQDEIQRALSSVHRTQTDVLDRQDASICLAARTQKQTACILRKLTRANANAVVASSKTADSLDNLTADVRQLLSLNSGSLLMDQSSRDITFLGECQDTIMAYLFPLQDDIDFAINFLVSQHGEDISASHAEMLRSEFQHLVGSAAQEKAAQYTNSTAKPFDRWSYPEDTIGFLKYSIRNRKARSSLHSSGTHEKSSKKQVAWLRKRPGPSNRVFYVQTSSGSMQITMPRFQTTAETFQCKEEVGFSCTITQNHSSIQINARFLRELVYASQPRMYAQLNIFTVVGDRDIIEDMTALLRDGSLADIDSAFRKGTLSPFHLDHFGDNIYLFVSITLLYLVRP